MVASESFAEFLREQFAPLGRITLRRMFGKTGVFCDGVMLAMVTENTLYFRVDDHNREMFREAQSFPPLNHAKKGSTIDLSFWRVPERLFDEPEELIAWADGGKTNTETKIPGKVLIARGPLRAAALPGPRAT
jgi:DNA transformation protein and related proteins